MCSQLQWAGPTISEVTQVIEETTAEEARQADSRPTPGETERLIEQKKQQFERSMSTENAYKGTAQDKNIWIGWQNSGILALETTLRMEVDVMKGTKGFVSTDLLPKCKA